MSLSNLITQPPSAEDQVTASLVTPLPPSPSKKRKTDNEIHHDGNIPNIDDDIIEESNNLLIDEMGLLTWDEVHGMPLETL